MKKPGLVLVREPFDCPFADGIAILAVGWQVQQKNINASVRELPGNAEPHCARTDYGCFAYFHDINSLLA